MTYAVYNACTCIVAYYDVCIWYIIYNTRVCTIYNAKIIQLYIVNIYYLAHIYIWNCNKIMNYLPTATYSSLLKIDNTLLNYGGDNISIFLKGTYYLASTKRSHLLFFQFYRIIFF